MNLDQQTAIYNKQATSHIQYVGMEQHKELFVLHTAHWLPDSVDLILVPSLCEALVDLHDLEENRRVGSGIRTLLQ